MPEPMKRRRRQVRYRSRSATNDDMWRMEGVAATGEYLFMKDIRDEVHGF